ncbi:MAG: response regulator [Candidatus Omnitrophica bacterium]|nr:response regulator [Candidatus Omnitrophota bacterium]MCA9417393.1 response regulator [Candidatus Omnitrophota bacterium]MCA9424753.1 response regulator [Candidatus Omnitrophota bacterium]MCA9429191.1 response regulator [Candidatus Omnitrophota bacterium]MCA9438302.1 response regulator [Candidatus Omnitrophota bacterium]
MSQQKIKEQKNLIENVIDWAKKCLEALRFQKAWQRGEVPDEEMAGPIRTTEEEQKLVEEIFNPSSTFPSKNRAKSGFDIHSIQIEVYGPKKVQKELPFETHAKVEVELTTEEIEAQLTAEESVKSLLPVEAPPTLNPTPNPSAPRTEETPKEPALPPAPQNVEEEKSTENGMAEEPEIESTPKKTINNKPHLLVIDDYEPLLNMLSRSLRAAGYEPICAHDGVEGIVKLHEFAVDLIITDVQMPKLDGFDMSKMLNVREETRDIPVIFLTEVLDEQTKTISKRLGAADTIIKPFTMDTLLESVKTVLAIHQAVEKAKELEPAAVS